MEGIVICDYDRLLKWFSERRRRNLCSWFRERRQRGIGSCGVGDAAAVGRCSQRFHGGSSLVPLIGLDCDRSPDRDRVICDLRTVKRLDRSKNCKQLCQTYRLKQCIFTHQISV